MITARIQQIINYLNVSPRAFALKIGTSSQVLGAYLRGREPSYKVLRSIIETYGSISAEWLLTGKGTMLKGEPTLVKHVSDEQGVEIQSVPVYELRRFPSLKELFSNKPAAAEYISIPNLPKCDGAVYMRGDTMTPELKSGDIALYKEISGVPHSESFLFGQIYLVSFQVEADELILITYVDKGKTADTITLVNCNAKYPSKVIPIKAINALAVVKASIRYNAIA